MKKASATLKLQREHDRHAEASDRARLRSKDAAALMRIREAIAKEKTAKKERMRSITQMCRAQRVRRAESAAQRRAALRALVIAEKAEDRASCSASKERAAEQVAAAVKALRKQGAEVHEMARITRPSKSSKKSDSPKRKTTLREESNAEVKRNIDHKLYPVWAVRASKTHATDRATRTERFLEWVEENGAVVAEILERENEKQLRDLVAQEKRLAKAMASPTRYKGGGVSHRIESHSDEWGAL